MNKYLIVLFLIALGLIGRMLPHPANFTPIGALAIFGGMFLPKKWNMIIPLSAMFISDLFLGFYSLPIMLSVYLGFAITGAIGNWLRDRKKLPYALGGVALGSVVFFFLTNGAVWAFGTLYSHNLSGLLQSYYMGLPFFRNSLAGDIIYTTVLVLGYEAAVAIAQRLKRPSQI